MFFLVLIIYMYVIAEGCFIFHLTSLKVVVLRQYLGFSSIWYKVLLSDSHSMLQRHLTRSTDQLYSNIALVSEEGLDQFLTACCNMSAMKDRTGFRAERWTQVIPRESSLWERRLKLLSFIIWEATTYSGCYRTTVSGELRLRVYTMSSTYHGNGFVI